ncbi:MAG: hypothetical protein K0S33_3505 [Bacteroidetes bacterium]|jgi:hypothetical protein|nr:hypothetical protein [Bacteroidota bacterium]
MVGKLRLITIAILALISFNSYSQYLFEYGGSVGIANYLGEIGGKEKTRRDFVADMKMSKTRQSASGFLRYKFHPHFYAKAELMYMRISGDDKLSTNPARNARNLSFTNDMFDLCATGQFVFYENTDLGSDYRFRLAFRAYVGGGIGGFYSNPKAKYNGSMVALRPLETEGVTYKAIGLTVPATIGFHFTYRKKHRFGWELNWRTTFTDYLDDVSQGWGDPSKMTATGAALSNRTTELDPDQFEDLGYLNNFGYDPVHNPTNKRGDPTHNDSYLTMNFSYSYVIRGKSSFYRSRYGSFFNKRGRSKIRKIRAKF